MKKNNTKQIVPRSLKPPRTLKRDYASRFSPIARPKVRLLPRRFSRRSGLTIVRRAKVQTLMNKITGRRGMRKIKKLRNKKKAN